MYELQKAINKHAKSLITKDITTEDTDLTITTYEELLGKKITIVTKITIE
jgi:hypothetical protein